MADQSGGMPERVRVEVRGGVADVRLCRPDKLNALDRAAFEQLVAAADRLAADRSVRAVVLSGEGRAFCAGLDVAALAGGTADAAPLDDLQARLPGRVTNLVQQAAWGWVELPVPVIAALHGPVLGGGLQIALAADVRIVAPDARLSVLEIRWGLVPDMTGTWTLPRLVGPDVAKELTWTGRTVDAAEAVRLGLATRSADDARAAASQLAERIAGSSPDAVRRAKALLDTSGTATAAEQLLAESTAVAALLGRPDQREAAAAFLEHRPPAFTDPAAPVSGADPGGRHRTGGAEPLERDGRGVLP